MKCLKKLVRSISGRNYYWPRQAARLKNLAVKATIIKYIQLDTLKKLNTISILEDCSKFGEIVYAYNI